MSKFSHDATADDAADDDARAMTIPRRFLRKQPSKKLDFTYYGTISILNDQSYELNKIINKDVLWFFHKVSPSKIHESS